MQKWSLQLTPAIFSNKCRANAAARKQRNSNSIKGFSKERFIVLFSVLKVILGSMLYVLWHEDNWKRGVMWNNSLNALSLAPFLSLSAHKKKNTLTYNNIFTISLTLFLSISRILFRPSPRHSHENIAVRRSARLSCWWHKTLLQVIIYAPSTNTLTPLTFPLNGDRANEPRTSSVGIPLESLWAAVRCHVVIDM